MIDLYTWKTANCQKVNIAVCEMDVDYTAHPIDINAGDQKTPDYLRINPNGKIPAIHDRETGVTLFESGAILLYLAERSGRLMPEERWTAVQWIMWQMSAIGPIAGQLNHFLADPARGQYALERFSKEYARLLGVLEGALGKREYLAGTYSVADIAVWPWITRYARMNIDLTEYPSILRWYRAIAARPKVAEGFRLFNAGADIPVP